MRRFGSLISLREGLVLEDLVLKTHSVVSARSKGGKTGPNITSPVRVPGSTLNGLARVFKLMSDESRLKILVALAQDGELNVTALCTLLGQSQPAVSHHLTLMRMSNLVCFRRAGKHSYYRIDCRIVTELLDQFFAANGSGHKQIQFDEFSLAYKRK